MFAQYGMEETTSCPYADLYIVDVPSNRFAPYGEKGIRSENPVEPGSSAIGILFRIIEQNIALKTRYGINHLHTGRILYQLINGQEGKEQFSLRDFYTGDHYWVSLKETVSGSGKDVSSSFHIEATVERKSGLKKNFTIGHSSYKRQGVKGYTIRQIILAPDGKSLVFVVEKEEMDTTGVNIRYMVETVRLDF